MQTSEPRQPGLREGPEAFYPIDMTAPIGELVLSMMDPEMFLVSQIHQAVVAPPPVRMDDAFEVHASPDDGLERGTAAIGHDLREDLPLAFEQTKDDGFLPSAAPSHAFYPSWPKVALIKLNLAAKRRFLPAKPTDAFSDSFDIGVAPVWTGHPGSDRR